MDSLAPARSALAGLCPARRDKFLKPLSQVVLVSLGEKENNPPTHALMTVSVAGHPSEVHGQVVRLNRRKVKKWGSARGMSPKPRSVPVLGQSKVETRGIARFFKSLSHRYALIFPIFVLK